MISLHSETYSAKIMPEKGANCVSLRNSRHQAIILREAKNIDNVDNPFLYGMPILYPANRIEGGRFKYAGRIYHYPVNELATNCHLHGMLHELPFEVEEQKEDYVKCVFQKPYMDFLHNFRIEISYYLSEMGLMQKTKIMNLSEMSMPNFLGFHTTFQIPFLNGSSPENIQLMAEISDEIERSVRTYLPTGKILPEDSVTEMIRLGNWTPLEQRISRHYKAADSGRMELRDTKKRVTLVYENDQKFGWRLIYNGNADDYICLEPMTCMVNCQNAPFDRNYAGFDSIAPHDSKEYTSKIYLREID